MRRFFKGGWTYDSDARSVRTAIAPPVNLVVAIQPPQRRTKTDWRWFSYERPRRTSGQSHRPRMKLPHSKHNYVLHTGGRSFLVYAGYPLTLEKLKRATNMLRGLEI